MATFAPFISPILIHNTILPTLTAATAAISVTSTAPTLTSIAVGKLSTIHAASSPLLKFLTAKFGTTSYVLYRVLRSHVKNTRITPIATYLAYKSSGYAESGPISGISISDFVGVWTPYNTGGGSGSNVAKKGIKALATRDKKMAVVGGTKPETNKVVMEMEGRESRYFSFKQDIHTCSKW